MEFLTFVKMTPIPIPSETDRLFFRQHTMADMDAYCAMEMDADVRRYVGGQPRTREEAEKRLWEHFNQ